MAPRPAMLLWWQCLSALLLLSAGSLAQDCTSGFMDRDLLTARATKIPPGQPGASTNTLTADQLLIIPGMNFSCSGTITSLKLGVDFRNNSGNLEISLWRPETISNELRYRFVAGRSVSLKAGGFSPNGVNEYIFKNPSNNPIDFRSGYMMAVYQPENSRTRLYYSTQVPRPAGLDIMGSASSTTEVPATGHQQFDGYLLLRPVTNAPESCLNGFLSDSELVEQTRLVNINGVVSRPRQQRLFPNIRFNCNGFITKWIVGAQTLTSGSRMPELQIWRLNAGSTNTYTKTNSSLITPKEIPGSPNVHEFIPSIPLQFNTGDILGVHQPRLDGSESVRTRFVLYYQENTGPANYKQITNNPLSSFDLTSPDDEYDYPLVSVEIISTLADTTSTSIAPCLITGHSSITVNSVANSESTSTLIISTSSSSALERNSTTIIATVVSSVVVILIITTAVIAVLIIVLIRKRQSGHKTFQHSVSTEMNGDVYSKIDGQQAENIVLQQNTAYWSQMKLQPNVSYVAPTVNNNKNDVYDYAEVKVKRMDETQNKEAITPRVQLHQNVFYPTSTKENHQQLDLMGVQTDPIVLQQNDAYGIHVCSSSENHHQQQQTELLVQDDDHYVYII